MNNIEYQTRQLIRELKRSNVYNQYRRLQMKIEKDSDLYKIGVSDDYYPECKGVEGLMNIYPERNRK